MTVVAELEAAPWGGGGKRFPSGDARRGSFVLLRDNSDWIYGHLHETGQPSFPCFILARYLQNPYACLAHRSNQGMAVYIYTHELRPSPIATGYKPLLGRTEQRLQLTIPFRP
jgi:hypothetical protein